MRVRTAAVQSAFALLFAVTSKPAAAESRFPPPPPLPSTVSTIRCFAGAAVEASAGNACSGALDDNGDEVSTFNNSVTASYNSPYGIAIDVQTDRTIDGGPDEAAGAGFTRFGIGFQLLKDLPASFDYKNDGIIPIILTTSTRFSYFNYSIAGIENEADYVVNEDLPSGPFKDYVGQNIEEGAGDIYAGQLLTERLVKYGDMVQGWRNFYTVDDAIDEYGDYVSGGLEGGSVIAGFTDVRFYDLTLSRTLLAGYSGNDFGATDIRFDDSFFGKAGDFFVVFGEKGAACLMDMYQENGSCRLDFDPVVTFDQAAFDRRMGDRTFNLADYYGLSFSGAVVPEPSTWMMMLVGFAMLGRTMRNRRYPRRANPRFIDCTQ